MQSFVEDRKRIHKLLNELLENFSLALASEVRLFFFSRISIFDTIS